MQHSSIERELISLSHRIGLQAEHYDDRSTFPSDAFEILRSARLTSQPPVGRGEIQRLLKFLTAIGRGDLNTGRIYEGHVNACWLIVNYGSAQQRLELRDLLDQGKLFGVWNTDAPVDPLHIVNGRLQGKKNFASGADGLSHAIVTVIAEGGRQMLLVPLHGLPVDRTWWRPVGMKASGSHIVDFTGVSVTPSMLIGQPDEYIAQPWFSAGAMRFLAVQLGGMIGIYETARNHLIRTKRANNPYQAHRLARMGTAAETGHLWIRRLGDAWLAAESKPSESNAQFLVASVNGARVAIEAAGMAVLAEAEQAIGAAGMIAPHPFERQMRDLRTYLRQPNPDDAAAQFGASIASGCWAPGIT